MEPKNDIVDAYTAVFEHLAHLGPGDSATTRNLVERVRADLPPEARVADLGCGTGTSALVLAQALTRAHVLALDCHAPFIGRLQSRVNESGFAERICVVAGDMLEPPPFRGLKGGFHLIWSESSIYSIGRTRAFRLWRPLLEPGGWLVFSDIVWHSEPAARSETVSAFWTREYPDITTADAVMEELVIAGFNPLRPALCGRKCWTNYYDPLRERLRHLATQENRSPALIELADGLAREIAVFDSTGDEIALAFFLARRDAP